MIRLLPLIIFASLATACGASGEQTLYLPVAGEISARDGGRYETDLEVRNLTMREIRARVTFAHPSGSPRSMNLALEAAEMRHVHNIVRQLGAEGALGSLTVSASGDFEATTYVRYRHLSGHTVDHLRAAFPAMPRSDSIGANEHVVAERLLPPTNIFVQEIAGKSVRLHFEGEQSGAAASQRVTIPANGHGVVNVTPLLGRGGAITVFAEAGEGRVVLAGARSLPDGNVAPVELKRAARE